jgi:5-hydroxyisourate hydrolase-like protein (transthyretin family)
MKQLLCISAIVATLLVSAATQPMAQAAGTSSISGQTLDAKTHKPVMGVRVDVYADTATAHKILAAAMSRKDGSFNLAGLDGGQYRVELTKMGYEVQVLTGLTVRSKERTIIGEPIPLHTASEEYEAKMACNSIVRPEQTGSVYVVCSGK